MYRLTNERRIILVSVWQPHPSTSRRAPGVPKSDRCATGLLHTLTDPIPVIIPTIRGIATRPNRPCRGGLPRSFVQSFGAAAMEEGIITAERGRLVNRLRRRSHAGFPAPDRGRPRRRHHGDHSHLAAGHPHSPIETHGGADDRAIRQSLPIHASQRKRQTIKIFSISPSTDSTCAYSPTNSTTRIRGSRHRIVCFERYTHQ